MNWVNEIDPFFVVVIFVIKILKIKNCTIGVEKNAKEFWII